MSSPSSPQENKKRVSKEKLRTIMEAANALTALGDEESTESRSNGSSSTKEEESQAKKNTTTKKQSKKDVDNKRFLPDHKKPDAALTFPEKVRSELIVFGRSWHGLVGPEHQFPGTDST